MPESSGAAAPDRRAVTRRRLLGLVKWSLCVLVLVFVGRRALDLWRQGDVGAVDVQPGWLVLAGLAYTVGWWPSAWFWRRLLQRMGATPRRRDVVRAFFVGSLGKYVPGKAGVLVLRAGLLRDRGAPVAASALGATYETLLSVGAALALAVGLAPIFVPPAVVADWPEWIRRALESPLLPATGVLLACAALLPVIARVLTLVAVRFAPRMPAPGAGGGRIDVRTVAVGLAGLVGGWALHGLSLGLVLRGLGGSLSLGDWPMWIGAVSLSTAVGFFAVFAPGGLGVREGILIELLRLQPQVGAGVAVVAAVLIRVVWLAAEVAAAALLYWGVRPTRSTGPAPDTSAPPR